MFLPNIALIVVSEFLPRQARRTETMLRTIAVSLANACWAMLMFCAGGDNQTSSTILAVTSEAAHGDHTNPAAAMNDPASDAAAALRFYSGNGN